MTFTPSYYKPQNVMNQMMGRMFGSRDAKKKRIAPSGLCGIELDRPAGDQEPGLVITRVWAGSPADQAGCRVNDRVLTLAGRWIDSPAEAAAAASLADTSLPVPIELQREDTVLKLEVTPSLGI